MPSIKVRSGEHIAIGDDVAVQVFEESGELRVLVKAPEGTSIARVSVTNQHKNRAKGPLDMDEIKRHLSVMAEEITSYLPSLDTPQGLEVLSSFIAELMSCAERNRKENRRQKQREGIAAAKANGVHFGRAAKPLPDNFHEICQEWREGKLSMRGAARACGMPASSFVSAAKRVGEVPPESMT